MTSIQRFVDPVKELQRRRQEHLGIFDTGLRCNCGLETIKDHASEKRDRHIPITSVVLGPMPSPHEQLNRFAVVHRYECNRCGAMYGQHVIERTRGYIPKELRSK